MGGYCGDSALPTRLLVTHHRLAQALALRAFCQQICLADASQALLAYRALRDLGRSRPRLQRSLRQVQRLSFPLPRQQNKLALWCALALPEQHQGDPSLLAVLQRTEAWRRAELWQQQRQEQRLNARWNHRGRLEDADQLLQELERRQPQQLVFWHHYDRRGMLPQSSRIPVHEELHREAALLFESQDRGSNMAEQFLRLSREPALWRQLSQAGR